MMARIQPQQELDAALAGFTAGELLADATRLLLAAHLAAAALLPQCCLLCNKGRLEQLFLGTRLCRGNAELARRLALHVYNLLAQYNGLG